MTARPAVALVFVLATSGAPAWAQGPAAGSSQVRIVGADCAAAPAFSTFVETLRVELAGHGPSCCAVESDALPTSAAGVDLSIEPCDPNREMVVVSIEDRARGRSVRRPVSLADVAPEARPRALALAVAELLLSLEQVSAPEPERTGPPENPPAPPGGGPRPGGSAGAAVGAELRYYPSPSTVLWGARLAPSFVLDCWFATLDLHAASGGRRFDIGTVDVRLFGAGLALGPRFTFGGAALDLGLAGEIGWAWIGGESIDPGSRAAPAPASSARSACGSGSRRPPPISSAPRP